MLRSNVRPEHISKATGINKGNLSTWLRTGKGLSIEKLETIMKYLNLKIMKNELNKEQVIAKLRDCLETGYSVYSASLGPNGSGADEYRPRGIYKGFDVEEAIETYMSTYEDAKFMGLVPESEVASDLDFIHTELKVGKDEYQVYKFESNVHSNLTYQVIVFND